MEDDDDDDDGDGHGRGEATPTLWSKSFTAAGDWRGSMTIAPPRDEEGAVDGSSGGSHLLIPGMLTVERASGQGHRRIYEQIEIRAGNKSCESILRGGGTEDVANKILFKLNIVYEGAVVQSSAGIELRPEIGQVVIEHMGTQHYLKQKGHGRAIVFAMILAGSHILERYFNTELLESVIETPSTQSSPFYRHIGFYKKKNLSDLYLAVRVVDNDKQLDLQHEGREEEQGEVLAPSAGVGDGDGGGGGGVAAAVAASAG